MGAESIYEGEGILYQINSMLPLFCAMGIDLSIGVFVEEFDNNSGTYTKRTIELNGKAIDASGTSGWRETFFSGVRLIDEALNNFGKQERVFGLFIDETSILVMLDEAQYEYLPGLIPNEAEDRPTDLIASKKAHSISKSEGLFGWFRSLFK